MRTPRYEKITRMYNSINKTERKTNTLQKKELVFFPFASCCLQNTFFHLQHYRSMELDSELSSKPWKISKTLQKINVLIIHYHVCAVSIWTAKT